MALNLGANAIGKLYLGSTQINKAYLGATVVFSGGSFDPTSLFAASQQGLLYEAFDIDTLFQDSAGTTPVTVAGQPVGLMLDKSGNGNHATQATAAKRPTYTTGSGLAWLAFDGVDDELVTQSNINVSGNSAREYIGGSGPGGPVLTFNSGGDIGERWTVREDNGNMRVEIAGSAYVSGLSSDGVVGVRLPGGGTLGDHVLSNGTTDENASGSDIVNTGIGQLYIGQLNNNTWKNAEFYGCTFINKLLTAQQRGDARQYYAEKRGVVL